MLNWQRMLWLYDMTADGVVPGYLNQLAITDVGDRNLQIDSGGAIVAGFPYFNVGAGNLTLTHPTVDITGWRIVLRADWAAQTVRLALLQSADGVAAIPALTQTDGTTYEISFAYGTITTGDVVAITDDRDFLEPNIATVPVGSIIMWSGTMGGTGNKYPIISGVANLRWQLCDGSDGAPDLRDRFIVGSGSTYAIGATGGAATVNLEHAHTNAAEATHTHTQANTGAEAAHTHTQPDTGAEAAHTHAIPPNGLDHIGGGNVYLNATGPGSAHSHTNPTTSAGTSHAHTNPTTSAGSSHNHTMDSQLSATQSILPPYYALAFLIRII